MRMSGRTRLALVDAVSSIGAALTGFLLDGAPLFHGLTWRTTVLDVLIIDLSRPLVLLLFTRLPLSYVPMAMVVPGVSLIYTIVKLALLEYDSLSAPLALTLWVLLTSLGFSLGELAVWEQLRGRIRGGLLINAYDEGDERQPLLSGAVPPPKPGAADGAGAAGAGAGEEPSQVPIMAMFRFADNWDIAAMVVGGVSAVGHGVLLPVFMVYFGDVIADFTSTNTSAQVLDAVLDIAFVFVWLGIAAFFTAYLQVVLYVISGQRQGRRIRAAYVQSLIRQDMTWYDTQEVGALTARLADDISKIEEGLSDKFSSALQFLGMFVAGFVVGFAFSWKLTLVIISVTPLLAGGGAVFAKLMAQFASAGQAFYAAAGALADESIALIKTVMAFGTQDKELARYSAELRKAERAGCRRALAQGLSMGVVMMIVFLSYALAFWYGATLIRDENLRASSVITVFFAVTMGAMAIGQAAPGITAFTAGRGIAVAVFKIIDRKPAIDSLSETGTRPAALVGRIELRDVHFNYPTRPADPVLTGLSFAIQPGQTVALVGPSGCGKSTVVALLERFYDPAAGSIVLDDRALSSYNVPWLRSRISVVSQMPALFPVSIYDNIAAGCVGATRDQVVAAAQMANAHDFIMDLPDKYDTLVGDRGAQLSGGQKQRVAIARALVGNPRILVLDEATSALDTKSEAVVQQALDRACRGRTTLVIAHRLSTIKDADCIVVVNAGRVVEQGTHDDLMRHGGQYAAMVAAQTLHAGGTGTGSRVDSADESETTSLEGIRAKDGDEKVEEELPPLKESVMWWALKLNASEWPYLLLGTLGSITDGGLWPAFSVILAEMLSVLIEPDNKSEVELWTLAFVGLGAASFLGMLAKFYGLGVAGEALTRRLREKSFHSILHQEMAWHDQPAHRRALLTSKLASDAAVVRGLVGERLGMALTFVANVVTGLCLAMYFCWRLALVVLGSFPAIAVGGLLQMKLMSGFTGSKHYEASGRMATEAVEQLRTVLMLGRARLALGQYCDALASLRKATWKQAQIQGVAFGFSEACLFGIHALAFWYGSRVVTEGLCAFNDMFKAMNCIIFGAMMAGQAAALAPDAAAARRGTEQIYHLVRSCPPPPPPAATPPIVGDIEFRNVSFRYPSRPDAQVLRNFSLRIPAGTTMAIVGPSGAGKSTITALLEQFYAPSEGSIFIDGLDLARLSRDHVRHHIGLVQQEPQLFSFSIRENITYGGTFTDEEIVRAARAANADDFITHFPSRYHTKVGELGSQLSGGQRQRVAIARALAADHNIKILLLDEATSALDTQNERIVQDALDRARQGRTCIVIAHRLSTIQDADCIAVLSDGGLAELGTHAELLRRDGLYAQLVRQQHLGATAE